MLRSVPRALFAGLVLVAAACSDRNPAPLPEIPGVEVPPPVHAALRCRMDVRARKLSCAPAAPETAPGVSPLIVGGQGTNVLLTSTGTSYDSTTQILRSDVTVRNLMSQALGTTDGAFPAPEGVRVFFHSGPVVTEGTGEVSVANADGEATFTSGAQPYFQYAGMLVTGSTSAPREWRFEVPRTVAFFAFTVFVAAPVSGPGVPPAAIVLLGGTGATDTVDAALDTPLRVGVRGADGKPVVSTLVEVYGALLPYPSSEREVRLGAAGDSTFDAWQYAFTDSLGIVEFRVKMGRQAGPARVWVVASNLALEDTARYTVLPGKTSQVRSLPADTAVVIGGRAPLRLGAFDRHGNARSDAVTLAAAAGPGSVAGSEVVAGASIGRVTAVATAAGVSDTTYVRVVPPGTVAAYTAGQGSSLYTFSLDASDVRQVKSSIVGYGYNGDMAVGWLGPTKLVYHDNSWDHTRQLYVLDLSTGASARFLPEADQMSMENYPRASRDGSWVYFSGDTYWNWSLYRARPDGTGKEPLSFSPGGATHQWSADPSPDGTRIVFLRGGFSSFGTLVVGELATGVARPLGIQGFTPRWSPDGTRIAFLATSSSYDTGTLKVVNADGSGTRTLTTTPMRGQIDWSPDGKYIVGATMQAWQLAIVEAATGAEVLVTYPGIDGILTSPVWKP